MSTERPLPPELADKDTLLDGLRAALDTLPAVLRGVSEGHARTRSGPDDWSVADVLSHLVDAENRYFERTRRISAEENPFLPFYPDDDYSALPIPEILARFASLRNQHVEFLQRLRFTDWQRSGVHQRYGQLSIVELVKATVIHDAQHTAQIARALSRK